MNEIRRWLPVLLVWLAVGARAQTDATAWCRALEARLAAGDAAAFREALDRDAMVAAATAGYADREAALVHFRAQLARQDDWGESIVAEIARGGSYQYVGVREVGGERRALFRLVTAAGMNYHELAFTAAAPPRVRDIFVHANGEWLTGTLRRAFLASLAVTPGPPLAEADHLYLEHLPRLADLQRALAAGDFAVAAELHAALPEAVRRQPWARVLELALTARRDPGAFAAAAAAYRADHPAEVTTDLVALEARTAARDWPAALAAVDRVDARLGPDPYLHVVRARLHLAAGDHGAARRQADLGLAADPGMADAHMVRLAAALVAGDHGDTARILTSTEEALGFRFEHLDQQPSFAEFAKSAAYRDWLAARPPPPAPAPPPAPPAAPAPAP